ncbi:ABC transporter substrate-binding protein [Bifidobacterium polysaccharolyticum]|uniref:ABC transporter substrate-binding protein n=1 Tax=Bifidobacterium polysaccharolyticum TaxID=2750967 RepID=UPI0021BA3D00|nr:ABC transporter substrate-binding protein [Bifidobacterium polysaccharolyticum]MCT8157582.1 ABC transporter substrate-binding protein [Bifidobacterium polysaccharolyticum]
MAITSKQHHQHHGTIRAMVALMITMAMAGALSACGLGGDKGSSAGSSDHVTIAAIYPKTGLYAEYGKMFQQGFDLAKDQINKKGGIQGKRLDIDYYDTQSDAKQDAAVAPKIAADKSVIAVVGDYSSPASSAASPIFQQAGLVHYGFNNSSPVFTKSGDHVWTPQISDKTYQEVNAEAISKRVKKVSVVYLENDWGKESFQHFKDAADKQGVQIIYQSSYLPDSTDLTPILIPAKNAGPDAVVDIGYGPDGALVLNTLRDKLDYKGPFFGGQETKEFLSLTGANSQGTIITGTFSATGTKDPKAKAFVKSFEDRYHIVPGNFEVTAYQAIMDLAHAGEKTSPTRQGIQEALTKVKDFPLYQGQGGTFKFNAKNRRADVIQPILLQVDQGKFKQIEE